MIRPVLSFLLLVFLPDSCGKNAEEPGFVTGNNDFAALPYTLQT